MAVIRGNPADFYHHRPTVYNHYVRVDRPESLIFVSGQVARDPRDGHIAGASMLEQTRQCLSNIETILTSAGASLSDVVWTTVYTTDIREFRDITTAREEFFKDLLPTSTMVEVTHLADPGLLVEISVIAAV